MPQFDSGAAEPIGRFSEGLLLRLLQKRARTWWIPALATFRERRQMQNKPAGRPGSGPNQ
jgi:hypothetical protein